MSAKILKVVKTGSGRFCEYQQITIHNDGKNPEIFYGLDQKKIIILPGQTKTFDRIIVKSLGSKKLVRHKTPKYEFEEV